MTAARNGGQYGAGMGRDHAIGHIRRQVIGVFATQDGNRYGTDRLEFFPESWAILAQPRGFLIGQLIEIAV